MNSSLGVVRSSFVEPAYQLLPLVSTLIASTPLLLNVKYALFVTVVAEEPSSRRMYASAITLPVALSKLLFAYVVEPAAVTILTEFTSPVFAALALNLFTVTVPLVS